MLVNSKFRAKYIIKELTNINLCVNMSKTTQIKNDFV
nr:MAG TPA: hypothetical protein [Caudoviricetes sp.]